MSLVADYGSSSESSNDGTSNSERYQKNIELMKLPVPKFGEEGIGGVTNSVFKNPFVEEENAKCALLEKHVKMIPAKGDITKINGKQICWMYRKGRCRFGHNCKFAHDSDLYNEGADTSEHSESLSVIETEPGELKTTVQHEIPNEREGVKRKIRPGLSQGLVPGKKVLIMYKKQKLG